jgi:hypothetical protein
MHDQTLGAGDGTQLFGGVGGLFPGSSTVQSRQASGPAA